MHATVPKFIQDRWSESKLHGRLNAAVLVIDISGFTTTTEAFLQHGQPGAERLAELLRSVLAPLVDSVHQFGGFLANFGGDGFTAIFPEAPSAAGSSGQVLRRALAASRAVQHLLIMRQNQQTPYGLFSFPGKACLTYGEVTWHIWRGARGENEPAAYFFSGPAIWEGLKEERQAKPGNLELSKAVLDHLQSMTIEESEILSSEIPNELMGEPGADLFQLPGDSLSAQDTGTSPSFQHDQRNLVSNGEFRYVLAQFIQLDSLPDPSVMNIFCQLLDEHGGYLCRVDSSNPEFAGPRLVLFWGAPTAYENSIESALDFTLEFQAQTGSRFRAGLTYQKAFAGFIGSSLQEEYTCYGIRVNLAARLMELAGWGDIWLGEEVAARVKDHYEVRLKGRFPVKSFPEPQPVFALLGRRESLRSDTHGALFVGRQAEIEQLNTWIQPALAGHFAGFMHLVGEAGVGKSRLVHEFQERLAQQADVQIWMCQAHEVRRRPLYVFRNLLHRCFNQLQSGSQAANKQRFLLRLNELIESTPDRQISAELQRTYSFLGALVDLHWPDSLYEKVEPEFRLSNTLRALSCLIRAESSRLPLLLVMEDLHWLDEESIQGTATFAAEVRDCPFAILTTSRQSSPLADVLHERPPVPGIPQQQVILNTIDLEHVGELLESILQGPIAPELLDWVAHQSDGNPFFIEQVAQYLKEQRLLEESDRGFQIQTSESVLPESVEALLVARLDRLVQSVRQVVQTAAVLGREFDIMVLSRMLGGDPALMQKIQTAEQAEVWSPLNELHYLFKHALLKDAAYAMQLLTSLRELHRLAAEAIETIYTADLAPHYVDLAYHYRCASIPSKEYTYARLAGEQAASQFANREALAFWQRALDVCEDTDYERRYEILQRRAAVYDVLGERSKQDADLSTMEWLANKLGDIYRQAEVALRRSGYAEVIGDYPRAIQSAQAAIGLTDLRAAEEYQAVRAAAHLKWGVALLRQGQYPQAQQQLEAALAVARRTQNIEIESDILRYLGTVAYYQGKFDQADVHFKLALDQSRQINDLRGEASALNNLGARAARQGHFDQARGFFEEALDIRRRIGDRRGVGSSYQNLGNIFLGYGSYSDAIRYYQQALAVQQEVHDQPGEGNLLHNLGQIYATLGQYGKAQTYYEQSLVIRKQVGDRRGLCMTLGNAGQLAYWLEDYPRAIEYCRQGLQLARDIGDRSNEAMTLTRLGYALAASGQHERAYDAHEQAWHIRQSTGEVFLAFESLANMSYVRLMKGDGQAAANQIEPVVQMVNNQLGDLTDPVMISWLCYLVLHSTGDVRAPQILDTAYHTLLQRASRILDEGHRQSYLENVAIHREIVQTWTSRQAARAGERYN